MSQSPVSDSATGNTDNYLAGWNQLADLIRDGASFSGREENCCFLNLQNGQFADTSSAWQWNLPDDGRGLAVVDWDQDGDIDVWLANRTGPQIRLLRNESNSLNSHHFVALRLQGVRCNRDAIGAKVTIRIRSSASGRERRITKAVRAGEGFLSQNSKWLTFGLGDYDTIVSVQIAWPGDSKPQTIAPLIVDQRYVVTQDQAAARTVAVRSELNLVAKALPVSMPSGAVRTMLSRRRSVPRLTGQAISDESPVILHDGKPTQRPRLISFWASWCAPCLSELTMWQANAERWENQVEVAAVSVDAVSGESDNQQAARTMAASLPNLSCSFASPETLAAVGQLLEQIYYRRQDLPLPFSLLFDADGQLAVIYKGPVSLEQLEQDVRTVSTSSPDAYLAARPLPGTNITAWFAPDAVRLAEAYAEAEYWDDAIDQLRPLLQLDSDSQSSVQDSDRIWAGLQLLAKLAAQQHRVADHTASLERMLQLRPDDAAVRLDRIELALVGKDPSTAWRLLRPLLDSPFESVGMTTDQAIRAGQYGAHLNRTTTAIRLLEAAVKKWPQSTDARFHLATLYQIDHQYSAAVTQYRLVLDRDADRTDAANNLAWLLCTTNDDELRNPPEALQLAQAILQTVDASPSYLDTLAAAFAANGQFEQAVTTLERAIELTGSDSPMIEKLTNRIDVYRRRQPWRQD
ncbi:MAG: ASPIC/UnbV domain-containing protein [Planctomycetales bacterium]|nr:ASPIC/UnbV domain-containing protein [Planctomycetales bacterium]